MRFLYASSFDKGAREIATKLTSRCFKCMSIPLKLSAQNEQLLHPASQAGSNMNMVDDQLRFSGKKLRQSLLTVRPIENILLAHALPRQIAWLLTDPIA